MVPPAHSAIAGGCFLLFALAGIMVSRVSISGLLLRAAIVLPFSATFAAISIFGGDALRGSSLVIKTYLSALFVLLLMATTPLPKLVDALHRLRAPPLFVQVLQLLWRYLFLIVEQAQHMRLAAVSRGGRARFGSAAGAVAVLFARSYQRAESIQRAMLSRAHSGREFLYDTSVIRLPDFGFMLGVTLFAALVSYWFR